MLLLWMLLQALEMLSLGRNTWHFSPNALQTTCATVQICCSSFGLPNPYGQERSISHKHHFSQSALQNCTKDLLLYLCNDWKSWTLVPKAWNYLELMPPFPTQLNMSNSLKALLMFLYIFVVRSTFSGEGGRCHRHHSLSKNNTNQKLFMTNLHRLLITWLTVSCNLSSMQCHAILLCFS